MSHADRSTQRPARTFGGHRRRIALSALAAMATPAWALPTGAEVAAGSVAIMQGPGTLTVQQASQRAVVNWQSFSVGRQETVNFVQPSSSSIALNRVLGSDASAVYGRLNANGQVFLVNPNGVLFGRTAEVNVGGLVASTLNLGDAEFLAGQRTFGGDSRASVTNLGRLRADGGYVALLGAKVANEGSIVARLGTVALAAGQQTTLDLAGDKLVSVRVDAGALQALASNGDLIQADGGQVILTARSADRLVSSVVNSSGLIRARTLENRGGVISLLGDMQAGQVTLSGMLDASAPAGGQGGAVETSAARVQVSDTARVNTRAASGQTGRWLIDPHDYTVAASGGDISGATLSANLDTSNITLQSSGGAGTGAGDLHVNDGVQWSADTRLTLVAANHVNVNAAIRATGAGAGLTISPNTANGSDAASGTGRLRLGLGATIDLPRVPATAVGALVIDGTAYTVINTLGSAADLSGASLQGVAGRLDGNFALGGDIDARASASWNGGRGFTPLGNDTTPFSGNFNGLGHSITGLVVNRPAANYVGLFGWAGGAAQIGNLALVDSSISGSSAVGALAGWNEGTLRQASAAGRVSGGSGSFQVGGLVGVNYGSLDVVGSTGTVSGTTSVGGLAGLNGGTVDHAWSVADVTGNAGAFITGGLLGENSGALANAYTTGLVSGRSNVGGLVGRNSGTVTASHAGGVVSGSSSVGGLVGNNAGLGTIINGFWNTTTASVGVGTGRSIGATGLSPTQMRSMASFTGYTFTSTPGADGWVLVDADGSLNNAGGATGATTPMLAGEYSVNPGNAHALQLLAMAPAAAYTLARNIDASASLAALTAVNAQGVATGRDVWGSSGFVPLGSVASPFSGSIDGASHSINGLGIAQPTRSNVGLVGMASGASLRNLGLAGGSISGRSNVGGLVGQGIGGSLVNVYSSASVSGAGNGGDAVGGLAGQYQGDIANAYSDGTVSGASRVGGLVGFAQGGSIDKAYASGAASGSVLVGGLVGDLGAGVALTNSFWNASATVRGTNGAPSGAGATGLTAAQLQDPRHFSSATTANGGSNPGWDYNSTWAQYDGHTAPLLRSFLAPLTVTAADASKTYDRQAFNAFSVSYSATPDGRLLGTPGFGGSAAGATQAGRYEILPTGLYSTQQGYALSLTSGTLTILRTPLTVSGTQVASKVYDRSTAATLSGGTLLGVVPGDEVRLDQAGSFASVHVGQVVAVTAHDSLGGAAAGNYQLVQPSGLSAAITPRPLAVAGASAAQDKAYDGNTLATVTGGSLRGLIDGDLVSLVQSGRFADRRVGSQIAVVSTSRLEGSVAGDYSLVQPTVLGASITPRTLLIGGNTVAANKVYDGNTSASVQGGTVSGVVAGDQVSFSQAGSFADRNAGSGKTVSYSNRLDGADAANYQLATSLGSVLADIRQRTLAVQVSASANKVYDGNVAADLSGNLVGVLGADQVTLAGQFGSKKAGTARTVAYTNNLGGTDSGNYRLGSNRGTTTADILPKALTVTDSVVSDKVYDGKTKATLTGGVLVGTVAGDKLRLVQAGNFITKNAGNQVPVLAADLLRGGDAKNYQLVQPDQLTGHVLPKTLKVTGTQALNRDYDGTTAVGLKSGRINGVLKGDAVSLVQAGQLINKAAGVDKTVVVSHSLAGADATNYVVATPTTLGKATVRPRLLTVDDANLLAADKTFDGTTAVSVGGSLLEGVAVGDRVVLLQSGRFLSAAIGADKTVVYNNELLGTDAGNYKLPAPAGGKTTAEILAP